MLKPSAWLLHLIGYKAPPAARDSSEVTRQSLSVGFSIQDEGMDVARSTQQGAHCHADVTLFLLLVM